MAEPAAASRLFRRHGCTSCVENGPAYHFPRGSDQALDDFSPVFGKDKRRVSNRSSSLPDQKSAEHSHSNDRYQHSKLFIRRLAEAEIRDK